MVWSPKLLLHCRWVWRTPNRLIKSLVDQVIVSQRMSELLVAAELLRAAKDLILLLALLLQLVLGLCTAVLKPVLKENGSACRC